MNQMILTAVTPKFNAQEIDTKGVKEYIIEGYISTPDVDLVNEVVSIKALQSLVEQINQGSIKLDFDHETIHEDNLDMNPVGRIVSAELDNKGVKVKAILNSANRRFKEIWGSIKGGFIDAFSITFKALKSITSYLNGAAINILDEIKLINVALTGNPVNPHATFERVIVKALKETEFKAKYIKREGTTGNYKYTYRDEKLRERKKESGPLEEGTEEYDKAYSQSMDDAVDLIDAGHTVNEAAEKLRKRNGITKEDAKNIATQAAEVVADMDSNPGDYSKEKENMSFTDVLNDGEGKKTVEAIEYIDENTKDKELIRIRKNLIKELKDKFGYEYKSKEIKSKSTTKVEDKNKMAEETKIKANKAKEDEEDKEEVEEEEESEGSEDSNLNAEIKSLKSENAKLVERIEKLEKDRVKPVIKALQEPMPSNELNEQPVTPLSLIR